MNKHTFTIDDKTVEILLKVSADVLGEENMSAAIRFLAREWDKSQEQRDE
jgi:hypothetical protein